MSGNPKNVAVKIKSHEKTQAQLDVSIAFVRWKAARATHWSRPRTGNRYRGDVLAEVFASDHKHCYDTRHDESDIAWVPQTRGDCDCHGDSFLALVAMQARFDPVLQDLLKLNFKPRLEQRSIRSERDYPRRRVYPKSVNGVGLNKIIQHANTIHTTVFGTLVIFGTPHYDL